MREGCGWRLTISTTQIHPCVGMEAGGGRGFAPLGGRRHTPLGSSLPTPSSSPLGKASLAASGGGGGGGVAREGRCCPTEGSGGKEASEWSSQLPSLDEACAEQSGLGSEGRGGILSLPRKGRDGGWERGLEGSPSSPCGVRRALSSSSLWIGRTSRSATAHSSSSVWLCGSGVAAIS